MANGAQNASGTPAPAASHSGGHVVSARATTIGLMAILLWSFMAGTVRIVSENFGATLGSALIYTVGGILLLMFRRPAPIREFPKKYLIIGGLLFVFYESSISLSLGLASTDASSVEVSLVNYLWPTMMVLLSAGVSHRKHAVMRAPLNDQLKSFNPMKPKARCWRSAVIPGSTGMRPCSISPPTLCPMRWRSWARSLGRCTRCSRQP